LENPRVAEDPLCWKAQGDSVENVFYVVTTLPDRGVLGDLL